MNRRERRSEAAIKAKSRRAKERKPAGEGGAGLIPDTRRFGSGFDSELTCTENRTVRIILAVSLLHGDLYGESEVVRSALEKLREQARQHGWPAPPPDHIVDAAAHERRQDRDLSKALARRVR